MKYRILSIILLLFVMLNMSSCYMGRWDRFHHKWHYVHKKKYRSFHRHRNRDW